MPAAQEQDILGSERFHNDRWHTRIAVPGEEGRITVDRLEVDLDLPSASVPGHSW